MLEFVNTSGPLAFAFSAADAKNADGMQVTIIKTASKTLMTLVRRCLVFSVCIKKTPLIAGTLHAVCSAFFRANFVRRFLRFFAPWQQHRQKRYTYHIFYGNFHQLRRFQLFNCFHNQKNILAQITGIALIQLYYTDYP